MEAIQEFSLIDIHTHKKDHSKQGSAIVSLSLSDLSSFKAHFTFADGLFYSVGIHPWYIVEEDLPQQLAVLSRLLSEKLLVAIGEGGFDRLSSVPMSLQIRAFEAQVLLAEQHHLPLIIHCVKAMEELLAIRKRLRPQQPWIWHGFRGKPEQALQLIKQGFYLSFGERYAVETLQQMPSDRLLLETDESSLSMDNLLLRAAEIRKVGKEELRTTLQQNVRYIFFKG